MATGQGCYPPRSTAYPPRQAVSSGFCVVGQRQTAGEFRRDNFAP